MNQKFRKFISDSFKLGEFVEIPLMAESRQYMALYSTRYNDRFDLPIGVTNFLNMIEPRYRTSALTWIMTEGLRKALIRRRTLATNVSSYLTKKLGQNINIPQDALFSKQAHKEIPQLGEIVDDMEKTWFDQQGEPDFIRVRDLREEEQSVIDIAQINAHLVKNGRTPLYFGGQDGLIEYLERGDWAKDQMHSDSRFGKQGHDLSLARGDDGLYRDPATGRQMYKFGLGQNSFVPSTNPHFWQGVLQTASRQSNQLLTQIIQDLQNNKPLDNNELSYIKELVHQGKIKSLNKDDILSSVIGLTNRQSGEPERASGVPDDYKFAKAAVKAVIDSMLQTTPPPIDQGKSMAMGHDPNGMLPPAKIAVDHMGSVQLKNTDNLSDPEIRDSIADQITNLIFNDRTGKIGKWVRVIRGTKSQYHVNKPVVALLTPGEWKKGQGVAMSALRKRIEQGLPIQLNVGGEDVTLDPKEVLGRMEQTSRLSHKVPGGVVQSFAPSKLKQIIDPERELAGYEIVGQRGNVIFYAQPGTHVVKKVLKQGDKMYEYEVAGSQKQDVQADEQNGWKFEYVGKGKRYAKLTKDGQEKFVRRVANSGVDNWYLVEPTKPIEDEEHLITPLRASVNTGVGINPSMRFSPDETNDKLNYFLQNWEEFGEPSPPKDNIPTSVWHGMGSLSRLATTQKLPHMTAGLLALANNVGSVHFRYGDLKDRRGEDVFELLNKAGLTPEEVQQIIPVIDKVIFKDLQQVTPHDQQQLFIAPNQFRTDVYEALLRNGYLWRKRKAASAISSEVNRSGESKERGLGQGGGGGDDDELDWTKVLASQDAEMGDMEELMGNQFDIDSGESEYDDVDDQYAGLSRASDEEIFGKTPGTPGGSDWDFGDKPAGRDLEKIARPKGTKRDISQAHAVSAGLDYDTRFQLGRNRTDSVAGHEEPSEVPTAPESKMDVLMQSKEIAPASVQAPPKTEPLVDPQDIMNKRMLGTTPGAPTIPNPVRKSAPLAGFRNKHESTQLMDYSKWLKEQEAVYDPKVKVKDGGGFNWWGAVGNPLGVSITGAADTSKQDPTGKGKRGKSRK